MALYIGNNIQSNEIMLQTTSEPAVWCDVQLKGRDSLLVGVVYRSPSSTDDMNKKLIAMMSEAVSRKNSHLLVMGDYYPGIDWTSMTASGSVQEQEFMDSYGDWFLTQHAEEPTRYRHG